MTMADLDDGHDTETPAHDGGNSDEAQENPWSNDPEDGSLRAENIGPAVSQTIHTTVEEEIDPEVAPLHAMFPDFDPSILQSILQSVGGSQDRAIDVLLGMSDPSYVSQEPPAHVPSQTELDEELARRLMLEEEQQHQQHQRPSWNPQQGQGPVPYQPRTRGQQSQGYAGEAPPRDTMAEFQDQFSKIAETGKKTFSSIVSKVKAKMQEFDQPAGQPRYDQSTYPSTSSTTPHWGSSSASAPPGGQPAYYDPNPQPQPNLVRAQAAEGYDVSTPPSGGAGSGININKTPPPPLTMSGSPSQAIDPTRLGMLPKRPVSLLGPSPPSQRPSEDDEEELEYVENPFEEGPKR